MDSTGLENSQPGQPLQPHDLRGPRELAVSAGIGLRAAELEGGPGLLATWLRQAA